MTCASLLYLLLEKISQHVSRKQVYLCDWPATNPRTPLESFSPTNLSKAFKRA